MYYHVLTASYLGNIAHFVNYRGNFRSYRGFTAAYTSASFAL